METNQKIEVQFRLHPGPGMRHSRGITAGRLPRVTRVLALALSFQEMVASGKAKNYAELATRAGVSAERLSQVMKLLWLAPDIQQEILYLPVVPSGRYPVSELALRHIARRPCWREQREQWNGLKKKLHLDNAGADNEFSPGLDSIGSASA